MDNVLEVKELSRSFPGFQLKDISFTLPKGYIMGLIGPNGSGKTTTIKLILNMLKRDAGEVKILGLDNIAEEKAAKAELAAVFDTNYFCEAWTVAQTETAVSGFYEKWDTDRFHQLLERFRIDPAKKVKELSRGMQMKLMLACAFSYGAKLLILDEPTSGLDPVSRDELLTILSGYIEDGEHSVLFSTHITGDLERAADYITYINRGSLFFTGGKDEFVDSFRIVKGGPEDLTEEIKARLIGLRTHPTGFEALVRTAELERLRHASGKAAENRSVQGDGDSETVRFPAYTSVLKKPSPIDNWSVEPATIDEIVVFTSKSPDDNGE